MIRPRGPAGCSTTGVVSRCGSGLLIGGWAARGWLTCSRTASPARDGRRPAESVLHEHFGQRSTGSFTFVARTDGNAAAIVPSACGRGERRRAATELPTGGSSVRPVARRCAASIVSSPRACRREGPHRRHAGGGRDDLRSRRSTSPARRRSSTTSTPSSRDDLKVGELYIAIPIALAAARLRLRDARVPAAVHVRRSSRSPSRSASSGSSRTSSSSRRTSRTW